VVCADCNFGSVLFDDVMRNSKYINYYKQVLEAERFPFELRAVKPEEVYRALIHLFRNHKLPFKVEFDRGILTINKKVPPVAGQI
jgi:hypothetical protein